MALRRRDDQDTRLLAPDLREALTGLGEGDFVIATAPHPHRPHQGGRAVLLPETQEARHERPGHRTAGRHTALVLACDTGAHHDLTATTCPRHRPGAPDPADPRARGPGLSRSWRHRPHPLLPPPRTPEHYQQLNRDHARLRAPGERGFAQLKSWRLLRRARCSTRRIGTIVQALHTLLTCTYSGRKRFSEQELLPCRELLFPARQELAWMPFAGSSPGVQTRRFSCGGRPLPGRYRFTTSKWVVASTAPCSPISFTR
jgi:hypothetical protein